MNGANEFKVRIDRKALGEILNRMQGQRLPVKLSRLTYPEIQTYFVLKALTEYLEASKCEPDFELVLNE